MITKNNFFEKAKEKFGDKFDYSKSIYTKADEDIIIICPKHGEFITKPGNFIRSIHGCKKCANEHLGKNQRKSPEKFIEECKKVWGNRYIYEKTNYIDCETKVIVTCPIHGDFETRPADFLRKHGCPKCKGVKTSILNKKIHRWTLEDFINKSKLLYDNLFDYSKVIYVNNRTKVLIHSNLLNEDFLITPNHFLAYEVPKKYLGLSKYETGKLNKEIFIQRAKLIYGNKYDYSKVEYIDVNTKVCIICPIHGEFWQTPTNHLWNREECPNCNKSKGEQLISYILDKLKYEYTSQYPIQIETNKYKIDFCLIINNKLIFIEYNGIQHYEPVDIFGGEEKFYNYQIPRDNTLKEYCKNNDIILLTYKYNIPFNELESIIKKDLNEIKNKC